MSCPQQPSSPAPPPATRLYEARGHKPKRLLGFTVTNGAPKINNYRAPKSVDLARGWHVQISGDWNWKDEVFPGYDAPIVRRGADGGREAVLARFGLIPWWAKTDKVAWSTMNARSETAAVKPAFKTPYERSQWCIVPAWALFEPYYALGAHRSERWAIERADGTALGIAGLWERWKSPAGDVRLSFTMLTVNCDAHPLLQRFHKHVDDEGKPIEKRTPVLLREEDYDAWLSAPVEAAPSFFSTFGSDDLQASAAPLPPRHAMAEPAPPRQAQLL